MISSPIESQFLALAGRCDRLQDVQNAQARLLEELALGVDRRLRDLEARQDPAPGLASEDVDRRIAEFVGANGKTAKAMAGLGKALEDNPRIEAALTDLSDQLDLLGQIRELAMSLDQANKRIDAVVALLEQSERQRVEAEARIAAMSLAPQAGLGVPNG
jgi:chromosome segregation ATPase